MIETERLILKSLTYDQLVKLTLCDNSLEDEQHLDETSRMSDGLVAAYEQTVMLNVADITKKYLYSTLWTAISKAENKMVGDLCVIGKSNVAGEIEIGYGVYEEFQNKGFMTEIVSGIIEWSKTQKHVKTITASTEKTNMASFRVLEKNNFIKIRKKGTLVKWRLEMNKKTLENPDLKESVTTTSEARNLHTFG